jgi:hypothetical protein
MKLAELQQLAANVGFPDPNLAAAVAMAESGGNPNAYGDAEYGGSVGLWQINLPSSPQYNAEKLKDPTYNAQAALAISKKGTNWNPWTTFRTGAYKQFYSGPGGPAASAAGWVKEHPYVTVGLIAFATAAGVWYFRPDLFRKIPVVGHLAAEENPVKRLPGRKRRSASKAPGAGGGRVQTLLFPRTSFTPESARSWAKSHGFKSGKVDVTAQYIRIRQLPPGGRMRTIQFQNTPVKAVVRFG